MKTRVMTDDWPVLATLFAAACANVCVAADGGPDWGYSGDIGPANWGKLSPAYAICDLGVNQSPVDIRDTYDTELHSLEFAYNGGSVDIVNNGHTLQVNAAPRNELKIRGEVFTLLQLHFHSPSEHTIDGKLFPLEAHFVHQSASGQLAVVAVLFDKGEWNRDLERIGRAGPTKVGGRAALDLEFGELEIYGNHDSYYRYNGSLTTPPCTEGISWYILKETGTIAEEQAAQYVALIGEDARGPQPVNGRVVLEH